MSDPAPELLHLVRMQAGRVLCRVVLAAPGRWFAWPCGCLCWALPLVDYYLQHARQSAGGPAGAGMP
jgi:hypothetical protein